MTNARTVAVAFRRDVPKRILALDGGGLRGILTLGYLRRIEDLLRERFNAGEDFRLAHYFDLIAGTSTGAIIAAALAKGMTAHEITAKYVKLGKEVFSGKNWFSNVFRDKYDKAKLEKHLRAILGETTTLGDPSLLTGLLIVTKRTDTGSPWPLGNNPNGKYFRAPPGATWTSNGDYKLWQVVRASTAAPTYFEPEKIAIGGKQVGNFVDGGVTPHNNPALQAFMYATLSGFGVNWQTGEDELLIVSLGTGAAHPAIGGSWMSALEGAKVLSGLMTDSAALVETMMQWMSRSATARRIDGEIEDLSGDVLGGTPQFQYIRYNVELTESGLAPYLPGIPDDRLKTLSEMDKAENLEILKDIGERAAAAQILPAHFPPRFDIR
jgi:predicted acylesterase/phospholipase RssA